MFILIKVDLKYTFPENLECLQVQHLGLFSVGRNGRIKIYYPVDSSSLLLKCCPHLVFNFVTTHRFAFKC